MKSKNQPIDLLRSITKKTSNLFELGKKVKEIANSKISKLCWKDIGQEISGNNYIAGNRIKTALENTKKGKNISDFLKKLKETKDMKFAI